MKVLHVYRTYFPDPTGGLQEAIRQICLAVQPFGIENTIFTLSPNPEPEIIQRPEARVVRCRSWGAPASCDLGGLSAFTRFRQLASEADVVHYLFPWPFADLLHQIGRPRKPAVLTYISDVVRQRLLGSFYAPLMWRTLESMQMIVGNAPAYARTSPVLSSPKINDRLKMIPLGIDERSYPSEMDDRILQRLGIPCGAPFFLFIGVLRYYKGLHNLIRAASEVDAPIIIAGTGPEDDSLRRMRAEMGADNVFFAGQITDEEKMSLLHHCRALILPSHLRSEAYGMVLVEAAMSSKPMVSCEIGTGTSFVNADKETGFVVAPDDPAALGRAMNCLMQDASLASRMGAAARARYEKMFSGEALGREYASLFHEAVEKYGRDSASLSNGSA
jgi:rhamnosyl/mannosyltransferase